jgi:hypothetical protein
MLIARKRDLTAVPKEKWIVMFRRKRPLQSKISTFPIIHPSTDPPFTYMLYCLETCSRHE